MAQHYFTADGNYGGDELVFIETTDWTEAMWEILSGTPDYQRLDLAKHFDTKEHDFTEETRDVGYGDESGLFCSICEMSADELGE